MDIGDNDCANCQVQFSEGEDLEVGEPFIIKFEQIEH